MAQRGTATPDGNVESFSGYTYDPAALIDLTELRFRWFDHVLKGGPRPDILADTVNYEVPGANTWKHAPSLAGMAKGMLTFHLSTTGSAHRLTKSSSKTSSTQIVNFADRKDVDLVTPGGNVLDKDLDTTNAIEFISEPFAKATEFSGLFSGHLEFVTNKKDFDFQISLYAQTPDGHYMQLAPYWSRASYVADLTNRHLLVPGARQVLDFRASRLMSFRLPKGSRLVAVLGVIKNPGQEINYGTGGIVADETIADAKVPLKIQWLGGSTISVPLGR
jgi:predicted acyl esterase